MSLTFITQIKRLFPEITQLLEANKNFAVPVFTQGQSDYSYFSHIRTIAQELDATLTKASDNLQDITYAHDQWIDLRLKMTMPERTLDNEFYDEFINTHPYAALTGKLKKYIRLLKSQKNELTANLPESNPDPVLTTDPFDPISLAHLPKMALPTFEGNCCEFPSFWSSFQTAVGDLPNISDSIKLSYLKSCLLSTPLALIESFPLVDQSYSLAVDLLKQKYENPTEISRSLCQSLKKLPIVRNEENFCRDLSSLINEFENLICRFKQQGNDPNNLHIQMEIESKLPPSVLEEIYKAKEENAAWTTELLQQKLKAILQRQEDISSIHPIQQTPEGQFDSKPSSPKPNTPLPCPQTSFTFCNQTICNPNKISPKLPCLFCNVLGHFSPYCKKFPTLNSRRNILKDLQRCFCCMKEGHLSYQCPLPSKCSLCLGQHPRALCPKPNQSTFAYSKEPMRPTQFPIRHSKPFVRNPDPLPQTITTTTFCSQIVDSPEKMSTTDPRNTCTNIPNKINCVDNKQQNVPTDAQQPSITTSSTPKLKTDAKNGTDPNNKRTQVKQTIKRNPKTPSKISQVKAVPCSTVNSKCPRVSCSTPIAFQRWNYCHDRLPQKNIQKKDVYQRSKAAPVPLCSLEVALQRIKFIGGATNTGQALQFTLDTAFQGARGGSVPKVVIVLTDGQSQDEVAEAAQRLRDAHVLVYAIGVSNLVNVQQLHQMTGNVLRVFTVESFDQLDRALADALTWEMCRTDFRPGTPDIICASDKIGVRASTKKPFEGFVFVQNHFNQPECRAGPENFPDSKSIGITVPFTNCDVHRYRSLSPKGIFVEMTVVFMFHSVFMTKVDQMVNIKCFYMEAEKPVTVPMEVSQITTQFRQNVFQMPRCEYTLRKDHAEGPIVQFAILGQPVYHRWECIEEGGQDTFGMLVHSCYVDNGFGDRVDILDENGCGLDAVLLRTPDYDTSLRLATKEYHVFKYADKPVLQFQCQVTLCLKLDGGCSGISPPHCPETKPRHLNELQTISRRRSKSKVFTKKSRRSNPETMDVFTKPMMIIDEQFKEITEECQNIKNTSINILTNLLPNNQTEKQKWILLAFISLFNLLVAGLTLTCWLCCKLGGATIRRRKGKWTRE